MKVIGIMSGTSMDGVDLALCDIQFSENPSAEILHAVTVPYEEKWRVRLSQLRYQSAEVYAKTDIFYGRFLGEQVKHYLRKWNEHADLICSHGHTIFHDPEHWLTAQMGDGETLSAIAEIPAITNFRRADVAIGGQGAPLAGLGDEWLFPEYDYCLNLGGFSNISAKIHQQRIAFDISPCNIILNRVAREGGMAFDEDGKIAENGSIDYELLKQLNAVPYYQRPYPKSLGREWINKEFWHIVRDYDNLPVESRMKTLVEHISEQIGQSIHQMDQNHGSGKKVLVTGGGAHNPVLIDHIKTHTDAEIIVPENILIDYKEALIFAFLGVLRLNNLPTSISTSTGASRDLVTGSLHGNFSSLINK